MQPSKYERVAELLRLFERSELRTLSLEFDGVSLQVSKDRGAVAPAIKGSALPASTGKGDLGAVAAKASATQLGDAHGPTLEGLQEVHAPMLGTFYRCSSPGEPPFVLEGSHVKMGDTLCLIECMKLFNTIPAPVPGRLVRFAVENGTLVEFNQPIAYIDPD